MKVRYFLTIFLYTALCADNYKLYFGTFDATHPKRAEKNAEEVIEKAKRAGLTTHTRKVENRKGTFLVVESDMLKDKESYIRAKRAAKRVGLDFFSKRFSSTHPTNGEKREQTKAEKVSHKPQKRETKTVAKRRSSPFFGSNDTMVELIETGLILQRRMAKEKEAYLKSIADAYDDNGLGVKLLGERALNRERNGIETGVVWDLFKDGYMQKRRIKKAKQLQKGIHFDADRKNISENYQALASYEIETIKNTIHYYFIKERLELLEKMKKESKRRVRQGLVTQDRFDRIDAAYQKAQDALLYFTKVRKKPFDEKYRRLIEKIETIELITPKRLQQVAVKNSLSLQMMKERQKLLEMGEDWTSKIKTDIYLDRKQYTFIDRRETLAGIHVKIPYNLLSDDTEMRTIERRQLQRKIASEAMLLKQLVTQYYDTISYKQNKISRIEDEIAALGKEIAMVRKSSKLGTAISGDDPALAKMRLTLRTLKLKEEEWILRAEILQKLIDLQYLTGIKVL